MKADVTIQNIYWNCDLGKFFFRSQSYKTLEELVYQSAMGDRATLELLDEWSDGLELDEVEEMFYSESVESIATEIGIELDEDEEDV
jgi:hypothetical protein